MRNTKENNVPNNSCSLTSLKQMFVLDC